MGVLSSNLSGLICLKMYKKFTPECGVLDVNKTIEWYKDNLGFEVVMTVPESGKYDWALMKRDSMEIMFQTKKSLEEEIPYLKNSPAASSIIIYIEVDNIKKMYSGLKKGVKIVKELHKTFYGSEEFAISDCNGFVLLFSEKK